MGSTSPPPSFMDNSWLPQQKGYAAQSPQMQGTSVCRGLQFPSNSESPNSNPKPVPLLHPTRTPNPEPASLATSPDPEAQTPNRQASAPNLTNPKHQSCQFRVLKHGKRTSGLASVTVINRCVPVALVSAVPHTQYVELKPPFDGISVETEVSRRKAISFNQKLARRAKALNTSTLNGLFSFRRGTAPTAQALKGFGTRL